MISVTILIKNGERLLEQVLNALQDFKEIILYDTGSNDASLAIAKRYPNVTCYSKEFEGFGKSHNAATALASNDWILSIDSDEVLSQELQKEILSLSLDPTAVYALRRHNYFNGKRIKTCGWGSDIVLRLYNRKHTQFSEDQVHETVLLKNLKKVTLKHALIHVPYATISDFLQKMEQYSSLFAKNYRNKRRSSLFKALLHGNFAFIKSYFLKRGFLQGYEGFLISAYNGHTAFYKYLKLYHLNKENSSS